MRHIELRLCEVCESIFEWVYRPGNRGRYCGFNCRQKGIAVSSAKKRGDFFRDSGECKTYRKRNGRHEHRVVMEIALGRKLSSIEVVHHINNDFRDNRLENLQLMSKSEHTRLHTLEYHKKRRMANAS